MSKSTKKIVYSAVLAAAAIILAYFVRFPIFPAASFLEYDMGDIPLFLGAIILGPWAGLAITAVTCILQGLTVSAQSGFLGILMHFFASGSFVICAGLIANKKTPIRILQALICGSVTQILIMVPLNLVISPALYLKSNFVYDAKMVAKGFVTLPHNSFALLCCVAAAAAFIVAFALTLVYTVGGTDGNKKHTGKKLKSIILGVLFGLIYGALILFIMNLIFANMQLSEGAQLVKSMIFSVFVPFNAIKAVGNSIIAYILYITVARHIKL